MPDSSAAGSPWAERAAAAEGAITARHLRRLFGLPGTELGVVSWPAAVPHRWWLVWHYWWQAHLIDCLVDAQARDPDRSRIARLQRVVRSHRLRNLTGWTNWYYDDMAWLGLALERSGRLTGVARPAAVRALSRQVRDHWIEPSDGEHGQPPRIGGLPWRKGSDFFNAPANGPAAILLARLGELPRAATMAQWLHEVLVDPATGLVCDGIRGDGTVVRRPYTYCQGVVIGLEVELARRTEDPVHTRRAADLITAVAERLCHDGVVTDGGGGDGGLFNGILARYLALAATQLPGADATARSARGTAADIVLTCAAACWRHRAEVDGSPLFGHRWTQPAGQPAAEATSAVGRSVDGAISASLVPERDLSVQLSGWMLLEGAALIERARRPDSNGNQ